MSIRHVRRLDIHHQGRAVEVGLQWKYRRWLVACGYTVTHHKVLQLEEGGGQGKAFVLVVGVQSCM